MSVQTDWSRWIFLKPNWSYSKNMVLKNGNLHVGYLKNMWTWLSEKSWRSGAKQYINKSKQYWGVVSEDGLCLNQGSPHLTFVGWQKSKRWEWAFYLRTFKNKLRVNFHCELLKYRFIVSLFLCFLRLYQIWSCISEIWIQNEELWHCQWHVKNILFQENENFYEI